MIKERTSVIKWHLEKICFKKLSG